MNKDTQRFIEYAQGTCASINEVLDILDIEDEDSVAWEQVDDEIFRCDDCSWWCEISEMDEEGEVCKECTEI